MFERWRTCRLHASFTVEMSLLMTLILPALIALILIGFYVHDQNVMQGAAVEVTAMGSNLRQYEDRDGRLAELASSLCSHRLMWTRGASGSASAGSTSAQAAFSGSFPVPGLIARFVTGGSLTSGASCTRQLYRPTKLIRMARGVKFLLNEISD